jgi:polysaccharide export outer membrane protein
MKTISKFIIAVSFIFLCAGLAGATESQANAPGDTPKTEAAIPSEAQNNQVALKESPQQVQEPKLTSTQTSSTSGFDPTRYTLGPEDVLEITVLRQPQFSGVFPVNHEGKIQLKFVGDIDVNGMTKKDLEDKIKKLISYYVIKPEVNVTILEYKSKVIYVFGEVGKPGKYYMQSESITASEAAVQAGLPTLAASMRKCRIITPDKQGRVKIRYVDLYSVLYGGDLRKNYDMRAGDILYVPSTIMAKVIRVINPVMATVNGVSSGPTNVGEGKSAITNMAK